MKSRIKNAFSFLRALIKPQHFEFVGYGICYKGTKCHQWKRVEDDYA